MYKYHQHLDPFSLNLLNEHKGLIDLVSRLALEGRQIAWGELEFKLAKNNG